MSEYGGCDELRALVAELNSEIADKNIALADKDAIIAKLMAEKEALKNK